MPLGLTITIIIISSLVGLILMISLIVLIFYLIKNLKLKNEILNNEIFEINELKIEKARIEQIIEIEQKEKELIKQIE